MSSALTDPRQAKPNFSGKWRLMPEPGAPVPTAPLLVRPDLTITQTADTLTAEQPGGSGGGLTVTITYKLDGSETRQTVNRAEITTKGSWDGETLVTTVKGPTADWKDVWKLVGPRLVIVTSVPGRTLTSTRTYERL